MRHVGRTAQAVCGMLVGQSGSSVFLSTILSARLPAIQFNRVLCLAPTEGVAPYAGCKCGFVPLFIHFFLFFFLLFIPSFARGGTHIPSSEASAKAVLLQ